MRNFLPLKLPELEKKETCDSCGESYQAEFIIMCDCDGVYCTFCYEEHEKICEEHIGDN